MSWSRYTGVDGTTATHVALKDGHILHVYVDGAVAEHEGIVEQAVRTASRSPEKFNGLYVIVLPSLGSDDGETNHNKDVVAVRLEYQTGPHGCLQL